MNRQHMRVSYEIQDTRGVWDKRARWCGANTSLTALAEGLMQEADRSCNGYVQQLQIRTEREGGWGDLRVYRKYLVDGSDGYWELKLSTPVAPGWLQWVMVVGGLLLFIALVLYVRS